MKKYTLGLFLFCIILSVHSIDEEFVNIILDSNYKLVEKKLAADWSDEEWDPIHYAAAFGDEKVLALTIESGYSIENRNSDGNTAIFESIINNNKETFRYLVRNKARLDVVNSNGMFPLLYVMCFDKVFWKSALELMVGAGADINQLTPDGLTILNYAIMGGNEEFVNYLISKGSVVNNRDKLNGLYPINYAVYITKNYSDVSMATDIEWEVRGRIEDILIKKHALSIRFSNTIGTVGNYFMLLVSIIAEISGREVDVDKLNRSPIFEEYKNLSGGIDIIINRDAFVSTIYKATGVNVSFECFMEEEVEPMLSESIASDKSFIILANTDLSSYSGQNWILVTGIDDYRKGQVTWTGPNAIFNGIPFSISDLRELIRIGY